MWHFLNATGLWPPVSPLSPIQQNTKHDIEPHHRTPNNSDMTEEESMQPQRVISVLTAIDGLQDMPANEKPPSRDVHAATPSAPIINITGQRRSSRDQGRRTLATWQMSEPVLVPSESSFQENGARPVSAHDSSRSPSANLGARAPSHGSSHAYSAGGPSILQWGNEMSLSVATGGVPRVSNEPKLSRAQKARRMMDAAQSNLEERIHPFSCADSVKNHVECREDGKLPNVRVSRDSRCPCLIFSINGGSFFRDGVASSKSVAKVVCNVSLGANSGRTLAATLEEDGSWESFTVFTFSLNIAQLHLQTQETSVPMKARQNVLAISCSILDEYGVQNVIGRVNFDLMAVLRIAAQKSDETVAYLLDDTSQHIRMPDKYGNMHRTCIYFSVDGYGLPQWISDSRAPGTNTGAWAPPSLDDFLKTVDEAAPSAVALKSVDAGAGNDTREASYGSDEDNDELSPDETHWREKLERIMDSLWMSFCVMVLVLIDIVLAIVFDFRAKDGSATPTGIIVVQSFILVGFVLELFLRYVAKRRRFWSSMWNVFDLVVIFSSVVIFVAILVVAGSSEPQGLGGAKTTTTALRVASRFATALRIVRILLALRKAQQFDVTSQIRTIVSQNKRRYKKHGFDLDLTYITNRVIAMSAPAFGGHSAYRNDMHMVARFFVQQHYSRFFIFNLCDTYFSSDGVMGNYNTKLLCGQCHRIPFEDHGPPLLVEMLHLCAQASRWCKLDQDHVIAVHCKGGKGRTGVMIAAFLLWTGHRRTAMDALELFSFRRTQNWDASLGFNCDEDSEDDAKRGKRNQGVDGPSQVRYVHYMEAVVNGQVDPYAMVPTYLSEIRLSVGPQQQYAPWYCSVSIKCMRTVIFDSLDFGSLYSWTGRTGEEFSVPVGLEVWGDVRIEIFRHKSLNPKSKRKLCFFCIFNTTFYAGKRRLVLKKNKVDMLHKDKQNKLTTADFNMTLYFELSETTSVMQRAWFESVCAYIGKPSQYVKGEIVIGDEDFNSESFFICTRGALEGVIHGDAQSGDHKQDHHLHGLYVPEGREAKPKKIPCSTIQGRGTLVGSYRFFLGSSGIEYRARTDIVQGYHVPRNLAGGPSQAKSVSDIRVSGVPDEKLLEFYEVMGWDAARSLLRIRTEVERLASMRAFNARTAVLNSADEKVQLISSISGQFGLPYNEEIRLCCRCSLKVSGHSGFNKNHEWLDVRCIIMNRHLLFDYAIFGPSVDICSFLLYNDEVLDVKEVSENPKNGVLVNIKTKRANLSLQIPSQSNGSKVLGLLHEAILCSKALRQRLEHHVFNAPLIRPILAAGKKEYLSSGQTFDIVTAACTYGFVYVEKGHFVLKKQGRTVAELMEGDVLGLPEFMLGLSLLGYSLQAHGNASEFILTQVFRWLRTLFLVNVSWLVMPANRGNPTLWLTNYRYGHRCRAKSFARCAQVTQQL